MALAVPVAVNNQPVCSGFIAGLQNNVLAIVTSLHSLGTGSEYSIGVPPHGGDVSVFQKYPLQGIAAIKAQLAFVEPLLDLAILLAPHDGPPPGVPRYISDPTQISVGEEILIVGYPFVVIGSFLETVEPCFVSALGNRVLQNGGNRYEFIISHQTHPGSSGSPVIRRSDGTVCGVLRGCLAPPSMLLIGNIPLGSDTNVTYSISAHVIPQLVREAFASGAYKL